MSRDLYLYALVGRGGATDLGGGLADEPLRRLEVGPVAAILGELEAPTVSPSVLAAHDAVVRRLAERLPALLPARFGQTVPDERTLSAWITAREREVVEALALVAGCVQMTLRVFAGPEAPPTPAIPLSEPAPVSDDLGPGARYLHARRDDAARARALPEIAPLRDALRPLLRAERVERAASGGSGRLRATAYDLVPRGEADAYTRTVAETAPRLAGWKITATGPWPPYAFAPGLIP